MKYSILTIPIILFIGLVEMGCQTEVEKSPDAFWVEGTAKHAEGLKAYLEFLQPGKVLTLDSMQLNSEGHFSFTKPGKEGSIYQVRIGKDHMVGFIPERDQIQIEYDVNDPTGFQVTGNGPTELYREFTIRHMRLYGEYIRAYKALSKITRETDPTGWRDAEARSDKALMTQRDYLRTFADTCQYPLLASMAATFIDPAPNYFYLQQFVEDHAKKHPDDTHLPILKEQLTAVKNPALGNAIPDFTGTTASGKTFRLTDLTGQMVLIYAWASYCEFSRHENAKFMEWVEKHPESGLSILSISIDESDAEWRKALAEYPLPGEWHIRGENSWSSAPFQSLPISSIPTTYLLDEEGIVRTLNLRSDDLEKHFEQLKAQYGTKAQ